MSSTNKSFSSQSYHNSVENSSQSSVIQDNRTIAENSIQATSATTEAKRLTDAHYDQCVVQRGLNPEWVTVNCHSMEIKEASQRLGYAAKSPGIWLEGTNGFGQFRPNRPWKNEGDKKAPKYRTAVGEEYDAMLPHHPHNPQWGIDLEALKVLCYQIDEHPCLIITEGLFKAIDGCFNGFATVAVAGVEMGLTPSKNDPQGKRFLVETLERLARAGFGFIIAFDADAATNDFVLKAQRKLGAALVKFKVPVYSVTGLWTEEQGKGMDDFLQYNGADKFRDEILAKAIDFIAWEQQFLGDDDLSIVKAFCQVAFESLYSDKRWICANDRLYCCYKDSYYELIPDAVEIRRIRDFCDGYAVADGTCITFPYADPGTVMQVFTWIKMSVRVNAQLLNPPGINCTNGVLQVYWEGDKPSWKLTEHSPDFYYIYRPITTYDPNADSKHCDRLLEVLEPAQKEIFLRSIAASLDLKTVRQYKGRSVRALLLKGDGSNGKDSLREVVSLMYGKQGITGCTLTDFASYDEGRKFSLAKLINARINWSSENANSTRLDRIQSLKAYITGDPLDSERKGLDAEEFEPAGIAIFNVNETPTLQGAMEAIATRYGILEFNKTFKIGADLSKGELEADSRFKYDLMFMQTLVVPAFLNRVLQALVDLMEEGIDYTCTKQALEAIQAENNHLFQFCQETGLGYDPEAVTTAADIWEQLEAWYKENGTLAYDNSRTVWVDQIKPSDKNVKAPRQVATRFLQLFPKAKRVMVPRPGGGKPIAALSGISFVSSPNNSLSISDPLNPTSEKMNPNLTQPVTQINLAVQGSVTQVTQNLLPLAHEENHQHDLPADDFQDFPNESDPNRVTWVTDACPEPVIWVQDRVTTWVTDDSSWVTDATIENEPVACTFDTEKGETGSGQAVSPSLSEQFTANWDSQWKLGNLVLGAHPEELKAVAAKYTPEQRKHLKDAANYCWKPQINKFANYAGEKVEVWVVSNQSREVGIRLDSSQKTLTVKRGNLRPWLSVH